MMAYAQRVHHLVILAGSVLASWNPLGVYGAFLSSPLFQCRGTRPSQLQRVRAQHLELLCVRPTSCLPRCSQRGGFALRLLAGAHLWLIAVVCSLNPLLDVVELVYDAAAELERSGAVPDMSPVAQRG
jgi:hypothetical protein